MREILLYHPVKLCGLIDNLSRACSAPYIARQIRDCGVRGFQSQMVGKKRREGWRESEPLELTDIGCMIYLRDLINMSALITDYVIFSNSLRKRLVPANRISGPVIP
jgi:hypothetical protein